MAGLQQNSSLHLPGLEADGTHRAGTGPLYLVFTDEALEKLGLCVLAW